MKNCCTDLYADDSTLHLSGKCYQTVQSKVQEDLYYVEEWCRDNNMFINTSKTKFMIIGTKQKATPLYNECGLHIHNQMLQSTTCKSLLGVKINPSLTWTYQIDMICSQI